MNNRIFFYCFIWCFVIFSYGSAATHFWIERDNFEKRERFKIYSSNKYNDNISPIQTKVQNSEQIYLKMEKSSIEKSKHLYVPPSGGYVRANFDDKVNLYTDEAFECVILGIVDYKKRESHLFHINVTSGEIEKEILNKIRDVTASIESDKSSIALLSGNYSPIWEDVLNCINNKNRLMLMFLYFSTRRLTTDFRECFKLLRKRSYILILMNLCSEIFHSILIMNLMFQHHWSSCLQANLQLFLKIQCNIKS